MEKYLSKNGMRLHNYQCGIEGVREDARRMSKKQIINLRHHKVGSGKEEALMTTSLNSKKQTLKCTKYLQTLKKSLIKQEEK